MRFPGFNRRHEDDAARRIAPERRPGETVEAYEDRRAAYERDRAAHEAADHALREAYAEGRRDQHALERRNRRPGALAIMVSLVVIVAAAAGVTGVVLAFQEGSFAAGGQRIDGALARYSAPALVAANEAADRTGAAVQGAGQALTERGEQMRDGGS